MAINLAFTKSMTGSSGRLFFLVDGLVRSVNPLTGTLVSETPANGYVPFDYRHGAIIAAMKSGVYLINGKKNAELQRIGPSPAGVTGMGPIDDWPTPRMMAAGSGRLFVIDHTTLWRVDPATLRNNGNGPPDDWPSARMMAVLGNRLFVIDGTRLWRVDVDALANDGAGPENDWPHARLMAAANGRLFVIDGTRLWRVNPDTLVNDGFGPANQWPNPIGMASDGKGLYVLDGNGKLWRVDQATLAKGPEVAVKP